MHALLMHTWTCNFDKMAEAPTEENCCVLKDIFHHKLDDLKAKQTKNESLITLFIEGKEIFETPSRKVPRTRLSTRNLFTNDQMGDQHNQAKELVL